MLDYITLIHHIGIVFLHPCLQFEYPNTSVKWSATTRHEKKVNGRESTGGVGLGMSAIDMINKSLA